MALLWVGAGGFLGSICRFLLMTFSARWFGIAFPWGTGLVNGLGCLAIGFLGGLFTLRPVSPSWQLFLVSGFLGGFTTFSALGFDIFLLLQEHRLWAGFLNGMLHLILGLLAVAAGYWLAQRCALV